MGKPLCSRTASTRPALRCTGRGGSAVGFPISWFRLDPIFVACVEGAGSPLGSHTYRKLPLFIHSGLMLHCGMLKNLIHLSIVDTVTLLLPEEQK